MTKYYSHNLIYILLLVWVFIDACNNTSSQNEKANASKPSPEITETPAPLVSRSVFKVCIKTGQEICGGVLDKDPIDLMANAFIKLKRMALGSINKIRRKIESKNKHAENTQSKGRFCSHSLQHR